MANSVREALNHHRNNGTLAVAVAAALHTLDALTSVPVSETVPLVASQDVAGLLELAVDRHETAEGEEALHEVEETFLEALAAIESGEYGD